MKLKKSTEVSTLNFQDKLHQIISKPLKKIAVCKDIPRLCKSFTIIKNGDIVYLPSKTEENRFVNINNFLKKLAECIGLKDIVSYLDKRKMTKANDLATEVNILLTELKEKLGYNENHLYFGVLKTMNQDALASSVIHLRNEIYDKLPYQDLKGTWKIGVEFKDDQIIITHNKKEKSTSHSIKEYFEFEWEFIIKFNKIFLMPYKNPDASIRVVDYILSENTDTKTKGLLFETLFKYQDIASPYRKIFDKSISNSKVSLDLPVRFAKNIQIIKGSSIIFETEPTLPAQTNIYKMLLVLCTEFGEKRLENLVTENFQKMVRLENISTSLKLFFEMMKAEIKSERGSFVLSILKCLDYEMLAPFIFELRAGIWKDLPFKDLKDSLETTIRIPDYDNNESCDDIYSVYEGVLKGKKESDDDGLIFNNIGKESENKNNFPKVEEQKEKIKKISLEKEEETKEKLSREKPNHKEKGKESGEAELNDVMKDSLMCLEENKNVRFAFTSTPFFDSNNEKPSSFNNSSESNDFRSIITQSYSNVNQQKKNEFRKIVTKSYYNINPNKVLIEENNERIQRQRYRTRNFEMLKKKKARFVQIYLSKKEQSHSSAPESYFQFKWACTFTFTENTFDVERKIINFAFHQLTHSSIVDKALQLFSPFTDDRTTEETILRFDFFEVLDNILLSLNKSDKEVLFESPHIPSSVNLSIHNVVTSLKRNLLSNTIQKELPFLNVSLPLIKKDIEQN